MAGDDVTPEELAAVESILRQSVDAGHLSMSVDGEGNPTFAMTQEGIEYVEQMLSGARPMVDRLGRPMVTVEDHRREIESLRSALDDSRADAEALQDWQNTVADRMGDNFDGDEGQEAIIDRWLGLLEERMKELDPVWHRYLFQSGPDPRSDL